MTLEQCKKLDEWWLPQDDVSGCFWVHKSAGVSLVYNSTQCSDYVGTEDKILFACPDLEQLLEFAKTKVKSILRLQQSYANKDTWLACDDDNPSYAVDPDPKVAVYKLLEKIMPKANQ